ncbi:hybrid sensor histidine kinase/response regulator [Pseudomonas sp. GM25]|uniref:hybrid sensor histidine kinase/response regulator n=1 Tax=Pseudomonas sp. GM25 TaxID=1144327 RepID=UPI00026FFC7A|nr:hybrid sensor histidine kinase/response regulator [Pseudomonas sp. GM25]EJM27512.1 signal transduction histidine kinase [Pseudomonas sp. GM25]
MNTDSLFGSLARSSMRLGSGLLLSLGLVFVLVVTNAWAIVRLFDSEREKADAHFSRVMKNVREQEVFLQAISDRLVAPTETLASVPSGLKQNLQFSDAHNSVYQVSEGAFSLPFMVDMPSDQGQTSLNALSSIGWHLTNYYSRFWAQSSLLSPQVFVFSPESPARLVVPAIGEFRDENLLTRQNYAQTLQNLYRQIIDTDRSRSRSVRWVRPVPEAAGQEPALQVAAFVTGELPINRTRVDSGMDHVAVVTLSDIRHSNEGAADSGLPFHGRFALVGPEGETLVGRLQTPVEAAGFAWSGEGLSITTTEPSTTGERWVAQYFVDYRHLAEWAALPVLRLLGLSILLAVCFRLLYVYYRKHVVIPAKVAQDRLVESQAFNRAVVESAPAGLVVIRLADGGVVMENQRAQQSTVVAQEVSRLFRKPGVTLSGEACMALQERHYLVNYASARYQDQDVLICAFSDVTEHQQRSVALRQAKKQAEKASEAKTIFLATMSHEIRTPLYGVLGTLELLGLTPLEPRQLDYLRTMQISSTTVLDIISDVLDVSKIESGQLTLEPVSFSPLALIEATVAAHIAGARSKNLQIYACIDPALPPQIHGDDVKLGQILNNLLSNAVKFTSLGRVVLRCQLLESEGQGPQLQVQVTDTGIGITAEQQLHIFEPFYQAHTSNLISGTGLGLSICSQFVALMGGSISVVSEQGLGSSFTVVLPLTLAQTPRTEKAGPNLSGRQIYIRAPVRELADNIQGWMTHWGASATVISPRSKELPTGALLVDLLATDDVPLTWKGKVLRCEYEGPLAPEHTSTGARVSAQHIQAIADGVLLATDPAGVALSPLAEAALPRLELHVLVAEDNLINQAILKEQLESLGCEVTVTGNGLQALQVWNQDDFDVVLSDVNMPVMNGYELTRQIRQTDGQVPIIGITANAMRDEGERCESAGMSAWMVKPLRLTDLMSTLSQLGSDKRNPVAKPLKAGETVPVQPAITLSAAMRSLFHSTMQQDMDAVRAAIAHGRQTDVVQRLHSVSGALSVVRADQMSTVFGQLEHQVRERSLEAGLVADIEQALDGLSDLLKSI